MTREKSMNNSPIDLETKIKILELQLGNANNNINQMAGKIHELQTYLVKVIANQTMLVEKLNMWPWLSAPKQNTQQENKKE